MSNQQAPPTHRSLTGFVTKLVGDGATYGFINEEIFFPQTNVAGGPASVGDQVFAECEYSAHLPIKWNATSVKILNKAGNQHQGGGNPILEQPQQDLMLQQQQQFNPTNSSVAVTYQQHRQQKQQQRQLLDAKQEATVGPQRQQNETGKLLNPSHTNSSDYYGQADNRATFSQQQPQDSNIQPFQDQTPMGPPNFTYTSQLGSAFVQNQFVPSPFLSQPPPSMLPQQQQPQHLLPNNQMHNNQRNNHQQQQHNKGSMNNRYNNNNNNQGGGEKNDRHMNNRRNNRNDNKFDRPRSGERDHNQGNRSSRSRGSRERSIGRTSKREDNSRLSPPSHSSARSNSINSDRGSKSKRHYEVQNIPRTRVMLDMNAYNMKQRCPSFLHVPSDLKDIFVNKLFRLDIKSTPKPIKFIIEEVKKESVVEVKDAEASKEPQISDEYLPKVGEETTESVVETKEAVNIEVKGALSDVAKAGSFVSDQGDPMTAVKKEVKSIESTTAPSSKTDVKLNHKYCVKVIMMSIPDMQSIYHSVFGPDLDSYSEGKSYSKLDETISLLCLKGTNNGYSLIGGKFDPILDGFIEGDTNEFERHGRQPDLIATCKRVVLEATSLDLGSCKNWSLLSTFIYNNKSDYFSPKASIEYSFIYMPQLWTMLSDEFDLNIIKKKTLENVEKVSEPFAEEPKQGEFKSLDLDQPQQEEQGVQVEFKNEENIKDMSASTIQETPVSDTSIEQLSELKVTDLKAELDRRNVKYKAGLKKAELLGLLQETIIACKEKEEVESDKVEEPLNDKPEMEVGYKQLEEGEVEAPPSNDSLEAESAKEEAPVTDAATSKRKIADDESIGEEPDNKKVCTNSPVKEKRIELISESFVVRCRDGQPQLSLVSLYDTAKSKNDQFELLVTSTLLKESLTQHLSEYILTTLVEDHRQRTSSSSATSNESGSQSNASSQDTVSDTNNNSSSSKPNFKNPAATDTKVNLKELPVDRYINLAFSYFDSAHMGYVYFEDLNKLFNNTGLTISKRALLALLGDGDKFSYRTLPDLSGKVPSTYIYEYPIQFRQLLGRRSRSVDGDEASTIHDSKMVEYQGVVYDVGKLVQQVKDADTMRVNLVERFNYAIENSDKQLEEIHVLEVSQKSLGKAIKAQNDEICDLKRERDSIKKKLENLRKGVKGTVTTLSDLIKDEK